MTSVLSWLVKLALMRRSKLILKEPINRLHMQCSKLNFKIKNVNCTDINVFDPMKSRWSYVVACGLWSFIKDRINPTASEIFGKR